MFHPSARQAYAAFVLLFSFQVLCSQLEGRSGFQVIPVGSEKQLFLDDSVLESMEAGVFLILPRRFLARRNLDDKRAKAREEDAKQVPALSRELGVSVVLGQRQGLVGGKLGQDRVGNSCEMARAEPKVTRLESGITHIHASSCNPKSQ